MGEKTNPDCPFPAQLELVPQMERGHVNIGVPIDIPFTEISRMMEAQLVGKSIPLDRGGASTALVRGVNVAASGGRLLISMRVKANEHKTWFGPVQRRPSTSGGARRWIAGSRPWKLRTSRSTFNRRPPSASSVWRRARRCRFVEKALTENASIDLKPIAANARKGIEPRSAPSSRGARRACASTPMSPICASAVLSSIFEDPASDRRG